MRSVTLKLLLLIWVVLAAMYSVSAQTCTGSLGDPVFKQTFGHGTTQLENGPPLPAGTTTLQYSNDPCSENDGSYGLVSFMQGCHLDTWQHLNNDHTFDAYGYFMLVNGPDMPEVVYSQKVAGNAMCPNTTYQFSTFIMNVLIYTPATSDWVLPNLTLSIEKPDGTVLKAVNTGDIIETTSPKWNEYFDYFVSPSDGSDVYVKIYDNTTAQGFGNDFAVDDIEFRPCGGMVTTAFGTLQNTATFQNICAGDNQTFTMVGQEQGYSNPVYQWQKNPTNDSTSWVDIPGANTTTLIENYSNAAAGVTQYRLGVTSSANTSASCRIYSQELYVYVTPTPVVGNLPKTVACAGHTLQLTANPGDAYLWTGPNGFTSTVENPVVSASATAANSGVYTIRLTVNGCSATDSTIVKVYDNIVPIVTADTTICQGSSVTLSAAQSTGVATFAWTPADGIDNAGRATITVTPQQTTTYTVNMDNGGCFPVSQTVKVTVVPKPIANAGSRVHIISGQSVKLNGTVNSSNIQYYWTPADYLDNPNSLTPIATPPDNITYTLHAIAADGCGTDTSSVYVRVYQKVTIPNTFTPNGDGVNDYWNIKNLYTYPESITRVFNRYGQQVYQSYGYTKPWDGTINGKPAPGGTYYYLIDLKNDTPLLTGWVLVVR